MSFVKNSNGEPCWVRTNDLLIKSQTHAGYNAVARLYRRNDQGFCKRFALHEDAWAG